MPKNPSNKELVQRNKKFKGAEEARQRSKDRYRELVENLNDVIFLLNTAGEVTYISPPIESILGYRPEELTQKSVISFIHPDDRDVIQKSFQDVLEKRLYPSDYRIQTKNGDYRWVRTSSRPVYKKGNIVGIQGVLTDITIQKNLESQLERSQKMEAIGTLAGGIAHDFNNILGIIFGCTELSMKEVGKGTPVQSHLTEILKAAQRAGDLVKQILTFSRQDKKNPIPLAFSSILKESLKMLRSTLPATISIRQAIQSDAGMIMADPSQMHQVIMNLATNALQAMDEKGGVLSVTLTNEDIEETDIQQYPNLSPGPYVRLTISDTGKGISPENLPRIFDPYFTTKRIGEGTGLGLAVIHGIIESHGGSIWVKSIPGKGTRFDIFFPRLKDIANQISPLPLDTVSVSKGKNERILFLDDELALVRMAEKILSGAGYQIETLTDSLLALKTFQDHPNRYDLIITDQTMPFLTGKELAQRILKIRPDMPIIICTGFSQYITEKEAKSIGIRAYLEKPLTGLDLTDAVRKVIDKKDV